MAEFLGRPLMTITSSDIGTEPKEVEVALTKYFKRAETWNAVLLIDEADVFMERRSSKDLGRNSLVAAFLRALEFFKGVLFLTTNRVGQFDDAFISRIHVQINYADFSDEERQQVWKTFIDKLNTDLGDHLRLTIDAKEYINSKEVQAVRWNGREIRNGELLATILRLVLEFEARELTFRNTAIQTAVALAEYEDKKGRDGRVEVTDDHLRAVVELSADFKKYLNDVHRGDEDKLAERRGDR
jgi:SpoVK/Ycf46/Vps4 family AAA+-type ATPase